MRAYSDGPQSSLFRPLALNTGVRLSDLSHLSISAAMAASLEKAPGGAGVAWGIPFEVSEVIAASDQVVSIDLKPIKARWFVFMHTADIDPIDLKNQPFASPMRGDGQLAEHVADYVMCYADGTEERVAIRRRHQIGAFRTRWGELCFEAVVHEKPRSKREVDQSAAGWGWSQSRVYQPDHGLNSEWINWLWAWKNPYESKTLVQLRIEPVSGLVLVSAVSAGDVSTLPLRWQSRRKACLTLPEPAVSLADKGLDELLDQAQLDMGQIISASPRLVYPNDNWAETVHNQVPLLSRDQLILEFTAHPEASFHLPGKIKVPVSALNQPAGKAVLEFVPPALQRVSLRIVDKKNGQTVAVKLHIHGAWGEYLPPNDRHRIVNPEWFEDYSVDYLHVDRSKLIRDPKKEDPVGDHSCTYIPGETVLNLPLGKSYLEVSKGFEIRPLRKEIDITPETHEVVLEIESVLPWRKKGWVTADTHVHFLSPVSALLEGAAEGVNIINLLASQWGELMTNVGDFDGRTTWGSKEAGGDGEYLVRVGTENRQHVLGHISLIGYQGRIISPMTTGGPDESALGDPIEVLLTEWARQCQEQGGVVVVPHFPDPRAEHAASIISGQVDAVEMTSWGDLYSGIDPYSLSDWYRYLNCGYLLAAVGGTDKMSASMAVGTVRTYAHIDPSEPFTYDNWMSAIRRAETFVTYGPLVELAVDGKPMGSRIEMSGNGGTINVTWQVASVTIPISRVELIVNGEIRESLSVPASGMSGQWAVKVEKSLWVALLVRGQYPGRPEIIAAHSSPVMILVDGSPMLAAADSLTILEQIEGALLYLDTVGTRAEDSAYKRMRLVLTSAHRDLHNRMHQQGFYHDHQP